MRNSQYLESYLACNRQRGQGCGLTVGSYLAYQLRGNAKKWAGRYCNSLEASCKRAGATKGKSMLGRVAYYPND